MRNGILPENEIGRILQYPAPVHGKGHTVTLGSGTPHSRALGAVKHPKLKRRSVCDYPRETSQSIYLSDNLTFSYSANGRITGHLGDLVHIHRDKKHFDTQPGSSRCGLTSGMTGTYYYDIVPEVHYLWDFARQI